MSILKVTLKISFALKATLQATLKSDTLCNDVLETALNVLRGLPPLSLSNTNQLPELGIKSLRQVEEFLTKFCRVKATGDEQGKELTRKRVPCLIVMARIPRL